MKNLKLQIQITMGLGIVALIAGVFTHLALTDIAHGWEPDLTLEWTIVQASAAVFTIFTGAALYTLRRMFRLIPD